MSTHQRLIIHCEKCAHCQYFWNYVPKLKNSQKQKFTKTYIVNNAFSYHQMNAIENKKILIIVCLWGFKFYSESYLKMYKGNVFSLKKIELFLKTGSDKIIHWLGRYSSFWVLLCQKHQRFCDFIILSRVQYATSYFFWHVQGKSIYWVNKSSYPWTAAWFMSYQTLSLVKYRVMSQALGSEDLTLDQSATSIQITLPEPAVKWHAVYKITTL